jgi:hypothetical protein
MLDDHRFPNCKPRSIEENGIPHLFLFYSYSLGEGRERIGLIHEAPPVAVYNWPIRD